MKLSDDPLCEIKEYKVYKALWAQRALLGVAFRDKKVSLQVPVVGGIPSHTQTPCRVLLFVWMQLRNSLKE